MMGTLNSKISVPTGSSMNTSGVSIDKVCSSETLTSIRLYEKKKSEMSYLVLQLFSQKWLQTPLSEIQNVIYVVNRNTYKA